MAADLRNMRQNQELMIDVQGRTNFFSLATVASMTAWSLTRALRRSAPRKCGSNRSSSGHTIHKPHDVLFRLLAMHRATL